MDGISFLVRVHNEEALDRSVQSLFALTIAYEVLVLVNVCAGACLETLRAIRLVDGGNRVRILHYNHTLSRPGYETLATDYASVHSQASFLNWGLSHARFKWTWKWDADFVMSAELAARINEAGLWAEGDRILELDARDLDGGVEHGDYASSCIDHYRKDVFWETPAFRFTVGRLQRIVWDDVWIDHVSRVGALKPYWFETGWFVHEEANGDEAAAVRGRLLALERDFGMQPLGLGRSGTTETATDVARRIVAARPAYVELWAGRG